VTSLPFVAVWLCGGIVTTGGALAGKSALAGVFARTRSKVLPAASAARPTPPPILGTTTRVNKAVAALFRLPKSQMTRAPLGVQLPWLAAAEMKFTVAGSVLLRKTPVAVEGPPLETVIVKVRLLPTATGSGAPRALIDKSALGMIVTA